MIKINHIRCTFKFLKRTNNYIIYKEFDVIFTNYVNLYFFFCSGNLERGIMLFEKALEYCRTTMELTHVYSLRDAAKTQLNIKNRLGDSIRDLFQTPVPGFP